MVSGKAAGASFARAWWVAVTGAAAILLGSAQSLAAEAAAEAAADEPATELPEEELSEVQVTGTRINSPNVTSANPINSISGDEMRKLGIVNVSDALTQLVPQNISTYMPTMVSDDQAGAGAAGMESLDRGSFFIGNTVANLRGLDPAFGSRTLTLIDGRRVPSTSNQADVVDLNIIPSNLLQRMDVVTGGASATYGSGAMAGVVNLVLNSRMQGFNVDLDYGVNEAGDGGNPHVAVSGGTALLDGRAHTLFGLEWQNQSAIWDCAKARSWCAESRSLFTNYTGSGQVLNNAFTSQPGYEAFPARFEMANVRYSQFAPTGMVASTSANNTSGIWISPDGRDVYTQPFGFRGGASATGGSALGANAMNGDGPLLTSGTSMRPATERGTFFANFEYDINDKATAYFQGNYSRTEAENRNRYTSTLSCVRFDSPGVNGTNGAVGDVWWNGTSTANGYRVVATGQLYGQGPGGSIAIAKSPNLQSPGQVNILSEAVRLWLGVPSAQSSGVQGNGYMPGAGGVGFQSFPVPNATVAPNYAVNGNGIQYAVSGSSVTVPGNGLSVPGYPPSTNPQAASITLNYTRGVVWPFWIPFEMAPNGPVFDFNGNAVGKWTLVQLGSNPLLPNFSATIAGNLYTPLVAPSGRWWALESLTLLKPFEGGTATVLPALGRNANAFLNQLSPAALTAIQNAGSGVNTGSLTTWGNNTTAGAGAGLDSLYGTTPCNGYTAMRKVWNPQIQQYTEQKQEPYRGMFGIKGSFGSGWRYDAYFQYGRTKSTSVTHNASTNLRLSFALDSVIDDRLNAQGAPLDPSTYGTPICRIVRDGPPLVDVNGRPVSRPEDLAALGADCQALNVFGDGVTGLTQEQIERQRAALDYAFVDSVSTGTNSLAMLSISANGTLWQGWAGPLTSAFGLEIREDKVNNSGTAAAGENIYERADLARAWADSFGGSTRATEGFTELDMPIVSGLDGANLWSLNAGGRWTRYDNKGGAGTTGESRKQDIFNWKFQTVFEPFDWVRLRLSRSRDLRTAGYRELFINQIGIPDEVARANPWRERTAFSTENQTDRYGRVQVGNINLKAEKSDTLTLGFVLSPGGWAQGMRMSVDYYNIRVKDAIGVPFSGADPVTACFEGSGNFEGRWDLDGNPEEAPKRDSFNYDYQTLDGIFPCREIQFGFNPDGTRNLSDIVSINSSRPQNLLPYQRRGIDLSWSYNFPLNRVVESLPGSMSLSVRGTRSLESSGVELQSVQCTVLTCNGRLFRQGEYVSPVAGTCSDGTLDLQIRTRDPAGTATSADPNGTDFVLTGYNCIRKVDLVGQIRSGTFIPGVAATPEWTGNVTAAYLVGKMSVSLNARYTGGAAIDKDWCDSAGCVNYKNASGQYLLGSVDNNRVDPYLNFSLSGSYDMKVGNLKEFQLFGSIANLFDKSPPFTGGGVSGASAQYHDILGRAYRMGVRVKF
jgi:outer membrane receptor protein involved in Fe transport